LANRSSLRESSQKRKTDPRSDSTRRACWQSAQRPALSRITPAFAAFVIPQEYRSGIRNEENLSAPL
jgi:hypothetical protein